MYTTLPSQYRADKYRLTLRYVELLEAHLVQVQARSNTFNPLLRTIDTITQLEMHFDTIHLRHASLVIVS